LKGSTWELGLTELRVSAPIDEIYLGGATEEIYLGGPTAKRYQGGVLVADAHGKRRHDFFYLSRP